MNFNSVNNPFQQQGFGAQPIQQATQPIQQQPQQNQSFQTGALSNSIQPSVQFGGQQPQQFGFGQQLGSPTHTNETEIFRGLSAFIRTHVLQPLSAHFASRGLQLSVEELAKITLLAEASPQPLMASTGIGGLTGVGGLSVATGGAAGAKKSRPAAEGLSNPQQNTCHHKFTRGNNVDKFCPKVQNAGSNYCSAHAKDAAAAPATAANSLTSFASPSLFGNTQFNGFPQNSLATNQIGQLPTNQLTLPIQGQGQTSMMPFQNQQQNQFGQGQTSMMPFQNQQQGQPLQFTTQQQTQPFQQQLPNSLPIQQNQQTQQPFQQQQPQLLPMGQLQQQAPLQLQQPMQQYSLPTVTDTTPKPVTVKITHVPTLGDGTFSQVDGPDRFIVRQIGNPAQTICVGFLDADNKLNVNMSPVQTASARAMNLTVVSDATTAQQALAASQTVQGVQTQLPQTTQTTQSVPAFGGNTTTTMFNVPQIPQVSQIPQTSQIPQGSPVETIPVQIPQITQQTMPLPTVTATN